MKKIVPFNPLDKKQLGEIVARHMLSSDVEALPPEPFSGAGIYAIYYVGSFKSYKPLADCNRKNNFNCPIYVGKAVPEGARKGGFGLGEDPGTVLYQRLRKHAASISDSENLKIEDFSCRYLVVDDIWIPLAESILIEMFSPLWNKLVDGFGNNDPGKGRYSSQKPLWDTLHPGRKWAEKLVNNAFSHKEIEVKIQAFWNKSEKEKSKTPPLKNE
jgi:hypothetical protein